MSVIYLIARYQLDIGHMHCIVQFKSAWSVLMDRHRCNRDGRHITRLPQLSYPATERHIFRVFLSNTFLMNNLNLWVRLGHPTSSDCWPCSYHNWTTRCCLSLLRLPCNVFQGKACSYVTKPQEYDEKTVEPKYAICKTIISDSGDFDCLHGSAFQTFGQTTRQYI